MALGSTLPLPEMSTRLFPGCKGGRCVRLTTLPPSCAVVTKSGNLNFLEPSGPLQACNGTALPYYYYYYWVQFILFQSYITTTITTTTTTAVTTTSATTTTATITITTTSTTDSTTEFCSSFCRLYYYYYYYYYYIQFILLLINLGYRPARCKTEIANRISSHILPIILVLHYAPWTPVINCLHKSNLPVPVVVRSWTQVGRCSTAGISGSNPASLVCVVSVVAASTSWSLVQKSPTLCVCVSNCVWSRSAGPREKI